MNSKLIVFSFIVIASGILFAFTQKKETEANEVVLPSEVFTYLKELGDTLPIHYIENLDSVKISQGEDLITIGYTRKDNLNTKQISKHFVCINCHNTVPENNHLANIDPEIRLEYMMQNKIPFLQGSTLYGVVNRKSYFNGDYEKKFGQLALNARDTLENAIQLCALISSEGRKLEKWESESILHYLHSIQLKTADLKLNQSELELLQENSNSENIRFIKSKYLQEFKATLGFPQAANIRALGKNGDWKKGEYIYKFGCMHCHNPEGITTFTLEDDYFNRIFLKERLEKTNNKSIYEITRNGTQPKKIKKTYMPPYTYEKLTDLQLEHLAAYFNYKPKSK